MTRDSKIYGVIVEWKIERPLVMERPLMTYEEAHNFMEELAKQQHVIRVCMFKAVYETGNKSLIEGEV